jgi:hypothetical protein
MNANPLLTLLILIITLKDQSLLARAGLALDHLLYASAERSVSNAGLKALLRERRLVAPHWQIDLAGNDEL